MAYGGSQVRALAASLRQSHSNARSKSCLRPTPQLMAMLDPNPLSEARDRTHSLMVPSWIRFCCTTTETPIKVLKMSGIQLLTDQPELLVPYLSITYLWVKVLQVIRWVVTSPSSGTRLPRSKPWLCHLLIFLICKYKEPNRQGFYQDK